MQKSIHTGEYKTVVRKLRKARDNAGLTQAEAAEKLGKPQSYISKIERGERRIDIAELKLITTLYKIRMSEIID